MNAICVWDFTVWQWTSIDDVKKVLREYCKNWCFQEEQAPSGGEHLQGRLSLKVKERLTGVIKKFPGWHFSPTSSENRDNYFYVTKEDTRTDGPWSDATDDGPLYIPIQIRDLKLGPWQEDVIESRNKFDSRGVDVIVNPGGNKGKSTVKTYIGAHKLGRALPFVKDYKDLMRIVMDTKKMPLYIIDMPRAAKKDFMEGFWSAIEDLKNGYAWDDRYKFKEEYFDSPRVWVFTNTWPDTNMLTGDRWRFWKITEKWELERIWVFGEQVL